MYQHIALLIPRRIRNTYLDLLTYCDIKVDHKRFLGFVIIFGLGLSFAIAFDLALLFSISSTWFIGLFIGLYLLFEISIYAWLTLAADGKGKFVDNILPDALQMMAMNMRAGLTTDRALIASARPEFGPLESEIRRAGKKVLSGKEIKYALLEIPTRIKSRTLDKTIRLIVEGLESGGELSDLLEQTAEDIENTKMVKSEVKASILMYALFIVFAVCVGAPLIFGISTYIVQALQTQFTTFQIPDIASGGLSTGLGQINIQPDFLILYSVITLIVTGFFGSLIIGLIKDGEEKQGIKYIPIIIAISLIVFFGTRMFVGGIFGSMV